jgi:alpha-glucoside transport system substrate-binding protein
MHKHLLAGVSAFALVFAAGATTYGQDLMFPKGEGGFNWASLDEFAKSHADLKGQTLSFWNPWSEGGGTGGDKDQWEAVLSYFADATGIVIKNGSSKNYEEQARIDIAAGSPSDITILPQPGLLADFAKQGALTDLGEDATAWLTDNYSAGSSWAALGQFEGQDGTVRQYAFPFKQEVKSLVWYSPDNFAEKGYTVPETWEDLMALQDKIVADGGVPWCIGIESGGATGWTATDWIEDILLRTQPPEVYDGWVKNTVKFNDPKIVAAIDAFGAIAKQDKYVAGGVKAVATTSFGDSPKGLFTVPPQCYLHRQASFIPGFFPEGSVAGEDYNFFYLPASTSVDLGKPVLGSGNLVSITKDSPAARAFIDFLKTPIAHEIWMAQPNGSFLSAHKGVNTDVYNSQANKDLGQILLNATTFRFDGSDLMPGPIGAGAFWTGMVDYVNGKSAQEVADQIQAAWDKL